MGYMMKEFYVYDTEATAQAAVQWINAAGGLPRIGKNAKNGQPAPDKCKTEVWAIPRQRLDGKWVFERVPKKDRDQVPPSKQQEFNTTFPHVIETESPAWWPVLTI